MKNMSSVFIETLQTPEKKRILERPTALSMKKGRLSDVDKISLGDISDSERKAPTFRQLTDSSSPLIRGSTHPGR